MDTSRRALLSSTGEGIPQVWERIEQFYRDLQPAGVIDHRRRQQMLDWLADVLQEELRRRFYRDPKVAAQLPELKASLLRGEITVAQAAETLLTVHQTNILEPRNRPAS